MKTTKLALIMLAGIAAAACGGGGGSDAPQRVTPLAAMIISAGNEQAVAGAAVDSALGAAQLRGLLPVGVQATPAISSKRVLSRLTSNVVQKIAQQRSAPANVSGVVTVNYCGIGASSGTFSFDDFGGTTSGSATFTNCDFGTGDVVNGTMSLYGMTQSASSAAGSANISLTLAPRVAPAVAMVGSFSFSVTGIGAATEITTLNGSHLSMTEGTLTQGIFDFQFTSSYSRATGTTTDSASLTVSDSALGGSFTFETLAAFVTDAGAWYPHSGSGYVNGAASTGVRVTILGNEFAAANSQVMLERSRNGGATFDAPTFVTWAALIP